MAEDRGAHGDIFDARALYASLDALARAAVALKTARDLLIASTGDTMHGATIHILFETALALTNELGTQFTALRSSEDLATRAFVEDVLDRLHAAEPEADPRRVTVPPGDSDPRPA